MFRFCVHIAAVVQHYTLHSGYHLVKKKINIAISTECLSSEMSVKKRHYELRVCNTFSTISVSANNYINRSHGSVRGRKT